MWLISCLTGRVFRLLLGIVFLPSGKVGVKSPCLGQFDGVGEVEPSVKRDEESTDSKWRNSFQENGLCHCNEEIGVAIEQHRMEDLFETGKSQT